MTETDQDERHTATWIYIGRRWDSVAGMTYDFQCHDGKELAYSGLRGIKNLIPGGRYHAVYGEKLRDDGRPSRTLYSRELRYLDLFDDDEAVQRWSMLDRAAAVASSTPGAQKRRDGLDEALEPVIEAMRATTPAMRRAMMVLVFEKLNRAIW